MTFEQAVAEIKDDNHIVRGNVVLRQHDLYADDWYVVSDKPPVEQDHFYF